MTLSEKLKEKIEGVLAEGWLLVDDITEEVKKKGLELDDEFLRGASYALDNLTPDVAVKFVKWKDNEAWELDYRESKSHTPEEQYLYFIKNVFKP